MKYIVSYTVGRYFQEEEGPTYRREGHSLMVQADNRVQALIIAFEQLSSQGYLVCTVNPENGLQVYEYGGGTSILRRGIANLSATEMDEAYQAGLPRNAPSEGVSMTHIKEIHEVAFTTPSQQIVSNALESNHLFVDPSRLEQLKMIASSRFDLSRLIRLCEELNICYSNGSYFAVAMLTRAILDHVPPIFGYDSFTEIANNYSGAKSFKQQMEHLQNSSRKIADAYLHTKIRDKESLPTQTQVNFANDIDVLLAEVTRILK